MPNPNPDTPEVPKGSPSPAPNPDPPAGGNNNGGQQTPPQGGMSPADLKSAVQEALAPLQGRLTKLEQRTKGRSTRERLKSAKPQFTFEQPPEEEAEPTKDELAQANEQELFELEKRITKSIFRDPKYQEILQKDPTLADVLENNPLALLKDTPIDAEDAFSQLVGILDGKIPAPQPPGGGGTDNPPKTVPEAGPTNPPTEVPPAPKEPEQPKAMKTPDEIGKGLADRMLAK